MSDLMKANKISDICDFIAVFIDQSLSQSNRKQSRDISQGIALSVKLGGLKLQFIVWAFVDQPIEAFDY